MAAEGYVVSRLFFDLAIVALIVSGLRVALKVGRLQNSKRQNWIDLPFRRWFIWRGALSAAYELCYRVVSSVLLGFISIWVLHMPYATGEIITATFGLAGAEFLYRLFSAIVFSRNYEKFFSSPSIVSRMWRAHEKVIHSVQESLSRAGRLQLDLLLAKYGKQMLSLYVKECKRKAEIFQGTGDPSAASFVLASEDCGEFMMAEYLGKEYGLLTLEKNLESEDVSGELFSKAVLANARRSVRDSVHWHEKTKHSVILNDFLVF